MSNKNKPNAMLAKRDAAIYARYRHQLDIANQMCFDAATIAANEVLGMGKGRAPQFGQVMMETLNEIATMTINDAKDDKEFIYTREALDRKLKRIVGEENFVSWEVRYGGKK